MESDAPHGSKPCVTIIVNPERSAEADELTELLGEYDHLDVDVVRPSDAADIGASVRGAVADGADIVAAVGGDGTQRTAAAAMIDSRSTLAVVPGGTVNLLGRVLGIESVADSAAAISSGVSRTIDTGVVNDETFVLNASSGYDADVMHRVDDGAKRWGRLGYFVAGLRELRVHRPRRVTVVVNGAERFAGRAMGVVVTNVGQRASADFTLAQGSAFDDGLLDVVVHRCDTVTSMLRAGWALARERDPDPDDLITEHGSEIQVVWGVEMRSQRDGDQCGDDSSFHHEVATASLRVCVPAET